VGSCPLFARAKPQAWRRTRGWALEAEFGPSGYPVGVVRIATIKSVSLATRIAERGTTEPGIS